MKEKESQFSPPTPEKKEGMKFIEGHPICGDCLRNIHNHPLEIGDRSDCKVDDVIDGKKYQCHCGFGGVYKDDNWQSWEE